MDRIQIPRDVLAAIASHARAEAPRECCGLLLGTAKAAGDGPAVRRAEPTRNLAPGQTRYDIDPADHFRILRNARRTGLTVLGAYHSHPTSPPVPSPTDLMEALPNFLYVIATLVPTTGSLEDAMRAYVLAEAAFREIRLVIVA
jgi:proteasome lid subunit RPN8/RPN11